VDTGKEWALEWRRGCGDVEFGSDPQKRIEDGASLPKLSSGTCTRVHAGPKDEL